MACWYVLKYMSNNNLLIEAQFNLWQKCAIKYLHLELKKFKGNLDLIPSPSHSVKIQIIGGKGVEVYLR